jgi:hypothetical protein
VVGFNPKQKVPPDRVVLASVSRCDIQKPGSVCLNDLDSPYIEAQSEPTASRHGLSEIDGAKRPALCDQQLSVEPRESGATVDARTRDVAQRVHREVLCPSIDRRLLQRFVHQPWAGTRVVPPDRRRPVKAAEDRRRCHCSVTVSAAIVVQAENLASHAGRVVPPFRRHSTIVGGDIEFAIRPETDGPTRVDRAGRYPIEQDRSLTETATNVTEARNTRDPVIRRRCFAVQDVHEAVAVELRVQRHAVQHDLAADEIAESAGIERNRCRRAARTNDFDSAAALAHEDGAVGQGRDSGGGPEPSGKRVIAVLAIGGR